MNLCIKFTCYFGIYLNAVLEQVPDFNVKYLITHQRPSNKVGPRDLL